MISPFNISAEQAAQELLNFNRKLSVGLKKIADMGQADVGTTPKEAVYREDKLVLYRYKPVTQATNPIPLLIVYALVNRPYMIDLQADRSMVRGLLAAGQNVYLIDWGYPDKADRYLTLDDYVNGYIHRCVCTLCKRHGVDRVNVLGICQGGVLSLCYSALHVDKVQNLITMVTPVDFKTADNLLSHWVQKLDVDLMVDTLGNIPGDLLNWFFLSMRPYRLTGQKYLDLVDKLDDVETLEYFLRMEKWIFDSPDQAGEAFRQFAKQFFQKNALIAGKAMVGEQRVNLGHLTLPIFNIYGTEDHLVPPSASRALVNYVGSVDYTELAFPSGHIGIYVSRQAQEHIPLAIGRWLDERG